MWRAYSLRTSSGCYRRHPQSEPLVVVASTKPYRGNEAVLLVQSVHKFRPERLYFVSAVFHSNGKQQSISIVQKNNELCKKKMIFF